MDDLLMAAVAVLTVCFGHVALAEGCTHGDIRLAGDGLSTGVGRVELCVDGVWGMVSGDGWDTFDAKVVCRKLRYSDSQTTPISVDLFGTNSSIPIIKANWNCLGDEASLVNCAFTPIEFFENPENVAGVQCYQDDSAVLISMQRREVHKCPSVSTPTTDADDKCTHGCTHECTSGCTDRNVRLAGEGSSTCEGHVELCVNGAWEVVLGVGWDTVDAQVLCRQLGCPDSQAMPFSGPQVGTNSALPICIVITNLTCLGNEASLVNCASTTIENFEGLGKVAGVQCQEDNKCTHGCTNGDVRLAGDGSYACEGHVELCVNGIWRVVLEKGWDTIDARVLCQQLGCPDSQAMSFSGLQVGTNSAIPTCIVTANLACSGDEASLVNCVFTATEISEDMGNVEGVQCQKYNGFQDVDDVIAAADMVEALLQDAIDNKMMARDMFFFTIDSLLEVNASIIAEAGVTNRVLRSLSTFGDMVPISSSNQVEMFPSSNFALQVQDVDAASFPGQTLNVRLGSVEDAMASSSDIDPAALVTAMEIDSSSTGYVNVPPGFVTLESGLQRLSYIVYVSTSFFPTESPNKTVVSIILAAHFGGKPPSDQKPQSDNPSGEITVGFMTASLPDGITTDSTTCSSWDIDGELGRWSAEDCRLVSSPGEPAKCSCTQLAHFGLLLDLAPASSIIADVLSIISYIGVTVSIICLLVVLITFLRLRECWKRKPKDDSTQSNHDLIVINMCTSLLGVYIFFIISGVVTPVKTLCGISSGLLQYFLLVFFTWTSVEAVFLFMTLVRVFVNTEKFALKAGLVAWIVPGVIVVVSGGAGYQEYTNPFYCRANGLPFYLGTVLPIALSLVFNWVIYIPVFVVVVTSIKKRFKEGGNLQWVKKILWSACLLSLVLGLGWVLGFIQTSLPDDSDDGGRIAIAVVQVFFTVFVGLQGILLLLFHVAGNKRAKVLWRTWLHLDKFSYGHASSKSSTYASTNPTFKPSYRKVTLLSFLSKNTSKSEGNESELLEIVIKNDHAKEEPNKYELLDDSVKVDLGSKNADEDVEDDGMKSAYNDRECSPRYKEIPLLNTPDTNNNQDPPYATIDGTESTETHTATDKGTEYSYAIVEVVNLSDKAAAATDQSGKEKSKPAANPSVQDPFSGPVKTLSSEVGEDGSMLGKPSTLEATKNQVVSVDSDEDEHGQE